MVIGSRAAERGSWTPVAPLRHYAVTASGEVDPHYASKFLDEQLTLDPAGSLFRYGEGIQRQLSEVDQVFWGSNYWLVGLTDALQLSHAPASLDLDISDLRSPWVIGLVTLPPYDQVAGDQRLLAERWLRRSIAIGRDAASFVHPLPHHFDNDGTPVFEADTTTMRLRCPSDTTLVVCNEAGQQAEIEVRPLTDEREIHIPEPGNWRVLLGGCNAGYIRVEDCLSLVPPRVRLEIAGEAALLPSLDSENLLRRAIAHGKAIEVAADVDCLRDLVTIDAANWPNSESLVWAVDTAGRRSLHINVRGVGAVGSVSAQSTPEATAFFELEAAANWLWSISSPVHAAGSPIRLTLPPLPLPAIIRRLEGRGWHPRFAAHVRMIQSRLDAGGRSDL
ncbi:MAG: hypothetical protein E6K23_16855 [Gammaproteobacteria bacterium]|nr:MAG: hypothetical protein E6K36_08615 [Gammaproteobacteria bacterium]TLZ37864.1 MAG: hypothetical protein E6K23_16855 [Gammaproteobacteria bacterium]